MKKIITFCFVYFAFFSTQLYAQNIEDLLIESEKQTRVYKEAFKNLVAKEKGTREIFRKDGSVANKKVIESNLIVYQTKFDSEVAAEYRHVTKIDGRDIYRNQAKTEDFFRDLLNSDSAQEELQRINEESLRFDEGLLIANLTLFQTPVLAEHIRPYFNFTLIDVEKIGGRDVYVVSYEQRAKSPYILVNQSFSAEKKTTMDFGIQIPKSVYELNECLRGKIWIDSQTHQIWREERNLTIRPNDSKTPINVFSVTFEFGKEGLGILPPKTIILLSFLIKGDGKDYRTIKDSRLSFEYSEFSGGTVTVKSSGIGESVVIGKQ